MDFVKNYLNVMVFYEEVIEILEGLIVIVIGLFMLELFLQQLKEFIGEEYLYFYDVVVLIVEKDSFDMDKVYLKFCYDKGEVVYLNCLMIEEEFDCFYEVLMMVEMVLLKEFEKEIFFEGCMLIEVMVKRGKKMMLFGLMKLVGLEDFKIGKWFYVVVQFRQDDVVGMFYNIVGFQIYLKWGD